MQTHSKSRASEESSCVNSRYYALSEKHKASPYWNNQPSCHLQAYIETSHSFRPQIHQLPLDLYPNRSKLQVSKDERFERLIDNQLDKQEELYKIKIRNEEQEVRRHCTFQPNPDREAGYDEEVFGRLYDEGLQKQRQKQRMVPESNPQCTFHPKTNKLNILNSEKLNLQPIYIRFKEEIKKELERKAQLKRKAEQQNEAMMTPFTVNQQSEKILQRKQNFNKNVVNRLLDYMKETEYRNKVRVQQKEHKLNQELTFAPEINPTTVELPGKDFIQRQKILAEQTNERMHIKKQKMISKECPFKPKVSVISNYLINIQRADEDEEQKIQRMYSEYPQIKQQNLQRIEEQAYKECTFHPYINSISKQLDANHVHHCCQRPKQMLYPHRPKLNQNSLKMASRKRNSSLSSLNIDNKVDKIKMELEYKKMRECTFKPKTLGSVAKSQVTIEKINGFENFMKNKELKLKQQQSQKEVQQRLFRMEKRYDQRAQKQTKIDQFRLSKSNKDAKAVIEEELKRFQESCPFKPNAAGGRKNPNKIIC